mmetsp:Transcript_28006/g.66207  ORF Transcript_28006/g.66207 Transcript_28006/m.66207 type:complete len:227 (+) Transcript_28006:137-817(+)
MLAVSICVEFTSDRSVLATFSMMRRRVSSVALAAVPTMISALATSLRSVLAVNPSQNILMPPATMGMEAVSVVFICRGSSPPLGVPVAVGSSTLTTNSTKMLLLKSGDAWSSKISAPSGMLKDTNASGIELGLAHMLVWGAQSWSTASSKSPLATRPAVRPTSWLLSEISSASSYSWQTCSLVVVSKNVPRPARTESSGISPLSYLSAIGLLLTVYLLPSVNVTCT